MLYTDLPKFHFIYLIDLRETDFHRNDKQNHQMVKRSKSINVIIVLIIIILLLPLSGCVSYRLIPSSELPISDKYHYIIRSQNSKLLLRNTLVSNDILSGNKDVRHYLRRNSINIYISSDSVIKYNSDNTVCIPLDKIVKAEKAEVGKVNKNHSPHKHNVKTSSKPTGLIVLGILYVIFGTILVHWMESR